MSNVISILDAIAPNRQRFSAHLCDCPECGSKPSVDYNFHGKVCIFCDDDNCFHKMGRDTPQAMGATLAEAARKWNDMSNPGGSPIRI